MNLPKITTPEFNHILMSGKKIRYRPFLVSEQKILLMAVESGEEKEIIPAIKQIIQNCILTTGVKIDDLPLHELEYLFLQIRMKSVGEIITIPISTKHYVDDDSNTNQECSISEIKTTVDLNTLKMIIDPEHNNKIEITPTIGMTMKYPTFESFEKLRNMKSAVEMDLATIISCIESIYDEAGVYDPSNYTMKELEEWLMQLETKHHKKILQFFHTSPKIECKINIACPKCSHKEVVSIDSIYDFFL